MIFYTKYKIIKKKKRNTKKNNKRTKVRVARAKVLEVYIYVYNISSQRI